MAFGWKLYGDGRTPPPGEAVRPDERPTGAAGQPVPSQRGESAVPEPEP